MKLYCIANLHAWDDYQDAMRCCSPGYIRVQGRSKEELERAGAEYIIFDQVWRGWKRVECKERRA